ncbi:putative dehydrogenase [Stella humosa]|uniref:Putative dehydrogenase n=1 Tax=Stella humosa TaxID=94 RepID=A0A3N1M610_9PROT|nr:Gfo/Idh/MocA family oxidoreductase [Stella humosa]ROQ01252.1 putative dehydrogenase [Stella humosa]BBK31626.1 NADH-dependent dehydrogenase [Stella humosa]
MQRIGLVGAGWVTQHHLDGYRALGDRVRVVAIADPSAEARAARAAEYGIQATYADAAAMLAAGGLDAVDVAVPREHHAAVCLLATDHGLPILCQKPLAPTLPEAEALVAAIDGRVRLMVHENWRFRPHYRQMRRWLEAGRIGRPRQALLTILTSGLLPDADGRLPAIVRQPFMAGLERMLLMEVLIHHVDALRFLLGPLALEGATLGKSCNGIRGEDRATLAMRSGDGAAVTLVGDFMAHGHPPQQLDRLEIFGEAGTIRLAGAGLELVRPDGTETLPLDLDANYKASYRDTIAHFLDRLADGGPFETAPADNLETLRIVERAYAIG